MSDLKDFGIFKTITAKDPIEMAIALAMIEEGEQEEEEEENEEHKKTR